ncbi:hypothetical protein [Runella sp. SP2]|uniref:hypothetical protein n=1 Tax=Runella sp. SP2 TaxID=2268026 RepID=UPI0013DE5A96|nr:hypothetical protein [Runella sp. SP2]
MDRRTLHERINLRGMLETFSRLAVADWQKAQDRAIYRRRSPFKPKPSGYLRKTWTRGVVSNAEIASLQFNFPLYGRFVDMGVGRGFGYADQKYASSRYGRRLGDGDSRKPQKWIGKTKTFSQRRLGELLLKRYGDELVKMVSEILTTRTTISL